ncbi:MAG TPA: AAA family ATPase [Ktedonobacteraceae bacterium]|nr:AAA family ATPase [Ktedonobacteraceae bacterium]
MKLRRLRIAHFKNLQNFTIDFGERPFTTVVLGQNGTGKSNLLEALIIIFRDLDLGAAPAFSYTLDYECRNHEIHIEADHTRSKRAEQVQITVRRPDGLRERIAYNRFWQDPERTYLPSYVFGYYSGPSNRMEKHFDEHQDRFYRGQLRGEDQQRRPLFYARSIQSQFALLAFFTEEEQAAQDSEHSTRKFLAELLGIEKLVSVLFVLHKPTWNSKEGDARFWNARGVLGTFLAHLYELAFAPMRRNVRVSPEFATTTTREHLYLYLRNEQALKDLFAHYGNQREFFKALESTYISKILSAVRIRLQRRNENGELDTLTFQDLSEGEQQLLMVLGLLRFTREDEALFLLDEPDTHLNPAWSIHYLEFMQRVVGEQPTSHVIMTTHDPLVIAGMQRQQVRVMRWSRQQERITAEMPEADPQGMGVAAILTSDLFGLRSTLDTATQDKLDRRRELAFRDDQDLSRAEVEELNRLNHELSFIDFSITPRDPLYQTFASEYRAFVREFVQQAGPELKHGIVFTPEQRERQRELTRQILRKLKGQRG